MQNFLQGPRSHLLTEVALVMLRDPVSLANALVPYAMQGWRWHNGSIFHCLYGFCDKVDDGTHGCCHNRLEMTATRVRC